MRDAIDEAIELLDPYPTRFVQNDVIVRSVLPPLGRIFVIGEVHGLPAAIQRLDADVAGEADAVMDEAEVVVVLGWIYHDAVGKRGEDESKHGHWIGDCQRRWAPHLLDIDLICLQPWPPRVLPG